MMFPFTVLAHRHSRIAASILILPLLLLGCKGTPAPGSTAATANTPPAKKVIFPQRPTVPLPPFKVFNHSQYSFTLTTKPDATDYEIIALIWKLRDATRSRTLDTLKISQKAFDADGNSVWFHIYRGTKCAPEKYAPGPLPCGGGYHAVGDYSYTTVNHQPWDSGTLLHDEDHRVLLWDPDAPPATEKSSQ